MKTSTRALLGTAGAIVGLMVILAVAARLWLDPIPEDAVPDPGPTVERHFDIEDFEGVNVSGAWRVRVSRGENTVSVRAPEGLFRSSGRRAAARDPVSRARAYRLKSPVSSQRCRLRI